MGRPLTYRDLEKVLFSLGFTRNVQNGAVFYVEAAPDAVIGLPVLPPEETLRPHHYALARKMVDGRGVADEHVFEKTMTERGELPVGVFPVASK